jgi:hypothetical protein
VAQYWNPNYWHANYWHANYWGGEPPAVPEGSYWATGYWHANYWKTGYWAEIVGSGNSLGAITVTLEDCSAQITGIQSEILDISVTVGPTWLATEYPASTGTIAVTLEDGTSLQLGTFTAADARVGSITSLLADDTAALSGTHAAPASCTGTIDTTLSGVQSFLIAVLEVNIQGDIVALLQPDTADIRGQFYPADVTVASCDITLEDSSSAFEGSFIRLPIEIDLGPQNPNAVSVPSNYEICDRTGFRLPRGTLRKQWDGLMVRPQSWESRHPQDFVRARPERPKGSPRPEQTDQFLTAEVSAEDL